MMYTLNEMNKRLDYLRKISAHKALEFFSELEESIKNYFSRDFEFELQVNKTLDKVIADTFYQSIEYEHQELIDKWKPPNTEAPIGYDNVLKLFKGDEVFEEIMTVTDKDFKAAFYRIENYDSGSFITKYGNNYLDKWIGMLNSAVGTEIAGLNAIMQYCTNRSYNVAWAILFEEHGKNINSHPVKYFAKDIFVAKGYSQLIEIFNLNIYRPSYMKELLDRNNEQ